MSKAWLAATKGLYAAFASRALAEDPRYTDKVFARQLNLPVQKFKDIVINTDEACTVSAWQLKTIDEKVRMLRANAYAELSAAISQANAPKRGRGTPASAAESNTPSSEGVDDTAPVPPRAKQLRVQFNSAEREWLKEHVGARHAEYKKSANDARQMICEEVLLVAMENNELRYNDWSKDTIKNQFKNFTV